VVREEKMVREKNVVGEGGVGGEKGGEREEVVGEETAAQVKETEG